jgi:hypothetical protein
VCHQKRIGDRRQVHEHRGIVVVDLELTSHFDRQASLTDAAGSGERDQSLEESQLPELAQLRFATDHVRGFDRQPVRAANRGALRTEPDGQKRGSLGYSQTKCVGQTSKGVTVWESASPSLEVGDAAAAHSHPLGQCFL